MRFLLVPLSLIILCGCTAVFMPRPQEEMPELSLPEMWQNAGKGNQGKVSTGWLDEFADRDMKRLVKEALENNQNLRATAAFLKAAREGTIIGRASRLPSISVSSSGSRSGSRSEQADGDLGPWNQSENYGLSLNASWELDLWGRLRDLDQASRADYAASLADFRGARLSLAANTARAWLNLIAAGQQVKAAQTTLESFARNFRITERNYKAGDPTARAIDVQFGRNNVASAQRSLLGRQLGRDEASRSLELLLGRYPKGAITERLELPELRTDVPAGLPAELLMRRPDLQAAAADVFASAKRADASRKNLLPSIRLSGGGSTSSEQLVNLIADPRSIAWNVAASLSQTLYQGGAPSAQARAALARNEAAIESFVSTALRAFREVESALATEATLAEQEKLLDVELRQAILAEAQAERDYAEGLATTLVVLEAQRRANSARSSMIALRNQRLQNRIDLHLALGGDFETPLEEEPSRS